MHAQCVHLPLRVLAGAADLGALRLQRGIDFDAGHRSRRANSQAPMKPPANRLAPTTQAPASISNRGCRWTERAAHGAGSGK